MKKKNLLVLSILPLCLMACNEQEEPNETDSLEQFETETVDVNDTITLMLGHGFEAGAFSDWTDCTYHYEIGYEYTLDGMRASTSNVEVWDTNAVERDGVETFLGDISKTYGSGLVQTEQDYYDGSKGIAYSRLGSIQTDGTESYSYITRDYGGTLQTDFLDVGTTIDDNCETFSTNVGSLSGKDGNYITALYGVSEQGHILLYIEMATNAGSYPYMDMEDWLVEEDTTKTTLECVYDLDYNLVSFTWSYDAYMLTNYSGAMVWAMGVEEEIDEVYQEVSLSRYDGEIEEPDWVKEIA